MAADEARAHLLAGELVKIFLLIAIDLAVSRVTPARAPNIRDGSDGEISSIVGLTSARPAKDRVG